MDSCRSNCNVRAHQQQMGRMKSTNSTVQKADDSQRRGTCFSTQRKRLCGDKSEIKSGASLCHEVVARLSVLQGSMYHVPGEFLINPKSSSKLSLHFIKHYYCSFSPPPQSDRPLLSSSFNVEHRPFCPQTTSDHFCSYTVTESVERCPAVKKKLISVY